MQRSTLAFLPPSPLPRPACRAGLTALLFAAAVAGQSADATRLPQDPWRSPIHTAEPGPEGLAYGTWAAGDDFKASFHGGFAFYPLVGDAGPNQPLAWRTRALLHGGEPVAEFAAVPAPEHTDWRCEYRFDGVTERYDVREDGVEQSFVLGARPAGDGDLAIVGAIDTPMTAEPRAPRHGELVFHGLGQPLVRYGKAVAIDARGRRSDVRTGFDGDAITLVVDDAFLDAAEFPVVVDPLFGRALVAYVTGFGPGGFPDVGHETMSPGGASTLFSYSRVFATGDYDGYARLTYDDLTPAATPAVFTDLTASWSTPFLRNSFVGGVGSYGTWVVALQRTTPATSTIWVHAHAGGDTTPSTAVVPVPTPGPGIAMINPDVGGTGSFVAGSRCLITCQFDTAAGTFSDIGGFLLDLAVGTVTPVALTGAPSGLVLDREFPFVSQYCGGATLLSPGAPQNAWLVTWQEYEAIPGDDWDVMCSLIGYDGAYGGEVQVGHTAADQHCLHPQVAGQRGRYALTYAKRLNLGGKYMGIDGTALESQRVDWAFGSAPVVLGREVLDDLLVPPNVPGDLINCCLAYDTNTRELWAGSYLVERMGMTSFVRGHFFGPSAALLDKYTIFDDGLFDGGFSGCTFDERNGRFPIGYFTEETTPYLYPLWGEAYIGADMASVDAYGFGCGGGARSFYELFATGGADLGGRTVRMTPNGLGGYDVTTTTGVTITPPTTPGLGLTDDSVSGVLALPFVFQFPGGSTTSMRVDSNGRVFLSGAAATSSYLPSVAGLLGNAVPLLCPAWSDLLPNATNNVHFHTASGVAYVTWNGVPAYGAPGSSNTIQIALIDNGANDRVEFRVLTWSNTAGAGLCGYSNGMGAVDPGNRDLTAGPFSTVLDGAPLTLDANARPKLGTTFGLVTSEIPPGTWVVLNVLSFLEVNPGFPLLSLGMDGCELYVGLNPSSIESFAVPGATWTRAFTLPSSMTWAGTELFSQSAAVLPGSNPFGMIASNGLKLVLNVN